MKELTIFHTDASVLAEFTKQGVRFLVVGGLAVHLHCPERDVAGKDLDLLIEPTLDNADCIFRAFLALGWPPSFGKQRISQPCEPPQQIPMLPYYCVDLVTTGSDIDFASEWDKSAEASINGNIVRYAPKELLIRMKRKAGRDKDLADIALLEPTP